MDLSGVGMTATTVVLFQIVVVALFIYLVSKVYRLYRNQEWETAPALNASAPTGSALRNTFLGFNPFSGGQSNTLSDYTLADWMAQAQMLAGIQMLDARRKGLALKETQSEGCKALAAAYLCGAAAGIGCDNGADQNDLEDVVAFLLSHNLQMDVMDVNERMENLTRADDQLLAYRCGVEGSEAWLERKYVPDELSLYQAVTSNTFI